MKLKPERPTALNRNWTWWKIAMVVVVLVAMVAFVIIDTEK